MAGVPGPNLDLLHELSESYAGVFDALDSLEAAGIRRELVPKLVVIGDQKSGKSSVLEAICQIPFPINRDLCTRFPTEVIQRKADVESVTVTINPAGARTNREALIRFRRNIIPGDFNGLADAIQQASYLIIGSPDSAESGEGDSFSDDVLRITISGPGRYPISLVDLPGLWNTSTEVQNKADKKVVDKMVRAYLREKRNALLLVVTARIHEAIQRAPDEVGNADASGTRTLGVITNLDAAYNEREVLARLANRGPWNPRYGWHCLRNLGGDERMNGADRDALEAAHFSENWTHVDETSKGITHLRPKLSKFLASQLRVHLPELVSEVSGRIGVIKGQLEMLRKRKTSEREQRDYLCRIALDFQHLCCNAVNGQYGEGTGPPRPQDFFNNQNDSRNKQHDKRLQAVVRAMGQLFNSTMIANGKSTELIEVDIETRSQSAFESDSDDDASVDRRSDDSRSQTSSNASPPHDPVTLNVDGLDIDCKPWGKGKAEEDESEPEDRESTRTKRASPSIGRSRPAARPSTDPAGARPRMPIEDDEAVTGTHQHNRTGYAMHSALRTEVYQTYLSFEPPIQKTAKQFEEKALEMAAQWRGTESLDEVNPAMVSQLFREETKRWRKISTIHLQLVWEAVSRFVHLALEHCVDPDFLPYLKRFVVEDRLKMLRSHAEGKLEELLRCHDGMNPAFHDLLCELREPLVWNVGFGRREAKKQVANELIDRIRSALSSNAWRQVLEVAGVSTRSVLNPSSRVASVLLEKVKESIADVGFQSDAPDVQESSGRRTAQEAAVQRAIRTTEKYYKASINARASAIASFNRSCRYRWFLLFRMSTRLSSRMGC